MSAEADRIPPRVQAEAATWLARLHADGRSLQDERAFQTWLADPVHATAFEKITEVWELAGGVTRQWNDESHDKEGMSLQRRGVLAGIGSLIAVGATFSVWRHAYAGVYETEVGEQKHVALDDGTQVLLDTDTRIRARIDARSRMITLYRGRANFRVKQDPVRPFVIDAAARRIVSSRSILDVRRDGDHLSVVLTEGQASVVPDSGGGSDGERIVTAGQRLIATPARIQVESPNLAPLLAWHTGQAMFENETLANAVAEMNRYSTVKLLVTDPAIMRLRLSGVYRVGDNDSFARSVCALLPVRLQRAGDHLEFVDNPPRSATTA